MRRNWKTAAVVSTLAAMALYALAPGSPAAQGACEQTARHWSQLNAWSSDSVLKPFALLLRAC